LDDIRREALAALAQECLSCRRCGLRQGCKQVVFSDGNPDTSLMLVGEGPGEMEDELGRPFVGAAGQLLDRILAAAGLNRNKVYIANVVKCRPKNDPALPGYRPGWATNRPPTPQEMAACLPWLEAQIALVQPTHILCLGSVALQGLVDPAASITRMRGRWVDWHGIRLMPTYHPAALLRDPAKKKPVWQDVQELMRDLGLPMRG